jgi:hypothetical protein
VSLAGTLLVALVGGGAGGAFALLPGLVLQGRQQRNEHDRWRRERMEAAATAFAASAGRAANAVNSEMWEQLYDNDKTALLKGVVERAAVVNDDLVAVHLAFGESEACRRAFGVRDAVDGCVGHLMELAADEPSDDTSLWVVGDRDEFDIAFTILRDARPAFTTAARTEIFAVRDTNAPRRPRRSRL